MLAARGEIAAATIFATTAVALLAAGPGCIAGMLAVGLAIQATLLLTAPAMALLAERSLGTVTEEDRRMVSGDAALVGFDPADVDMAM